MHSFAETLLLFVRVPEADPTCPGSPDLHPFSLEDVVDRLSDDFAKFVRGLIIAQAADELIDGSAAVE